MACGTAAKMALQCSYERPLLESTYQSWRTPLTIKAISFRNEQPAMGLLQSRSICVTRIDTAELEALSTLTVTVVCSGDDVSSTITIIIMQVVGCKAYNQEMQR